MTVQVGACAALALAAWAAPLVPIDPEASTSAALCAYGIAYACVAACALAAAATAPDLGRVTPFVVVAAAVVLVGLRAGQPSLGSALVVLACLLAAGSSAGAAIGSRIEAAGHLLPVAVISSFADAISVWTPGAPSETVLRSGALLSVLAIAWPMPGTHDLPAVLGVGDVVFVAIYVGAARKHGLSIVRTLVALAAGLAATACVVAASSMAIPALPLMGAAVVAAHPEARRVPQKDRRAATIGITVCVIAFTALVAYRAAE